MSNLKEKIFDLSFRSLDRDGQTFASNALQRDASVIATFILVSFVKNVYFCILHVLRHTYLLPLCTNRWLLGQGGAVLSVSL